MNNINGFSFEKERYFNFNSSINEDILTNTTIEPFESTIKIIDADISNNYTNLTNNIASYNTQRSTMNMDTYGINKYNHIYIPDNTDLIRTTMDVRKEDINTLLIQQNYIYIIGSITCATLLIAALLIGKN
jgi:hypothetical protein